MRRPVSIGEIRDGSSCSKSIGSRLTKLCGRAFGPYAKRQKSLRCREPGAAQQMGLPVFYGFWRLAIRMDSVVLSSDAFFMKPKEPKISRAAPPPIKHDEQPLLRILVLTAVQRGDTLAALARKLGVTYARLGQWRRGEAAIAAASRSVHLRAAQYLGIPSVLVLVLAGVVQLSDFVMPDAEALDIRIHHELEAMRQDPYVGAFVPSALATAPHDVVMFVIFLYREINGSALASRRNVQWISALHSAAVSQSDGAQGQGARASSVRTKGIF